ncbi:MAG: DoxX family protein [Planctomycetota bacterium]
MKHSKITFLAQLIAASLLLLAAYSKFVSAPESVEMFNTLKMEPVGRYLAAVIELTAALLLLSPFAALGSLLAVAMMCGAILAHTTRIGFDVQGDGGMLVAMLACVLLCSSYVLYTRRKELPIVGSTL